MLLLRRIRNLIVWTFWLPVWWIAALVPRNPRLWVFGAWDGLRALVRSLRMKARWPSREYERYLDRPLRELRNEFDIRVL